MPAFICITCGTQYPESATAPARCIICEEERQYVPEEGQRWTTLEALSKSHVNQFRDYEPGVTGIGAGAASVVGGTTTVMLVVVGAVEGATGAADEVVLSVYAANTCVG